MALHAAPAPPAACAVRSAPHRRQAASRQFHIREGHLQVPRKHSEEVGGVPYMLGTFTGNARRRADKLTPERRAELTELGMRW